MYVVMKYMFFLILNTIVIVLKFILFQNDIWDA